MRNIVGSTLVMALLLGPCAEVVLAADEASAETSGGGPKRKARIIKTAPPESPYIADRPPASRGGKDSIEGFKKHSGNVVVDAFVERPVGMVASAGGFGVFVATLPFSIFGGNTKECFQKLVKTPLKYSFARPLGHYGGDGDW